VLQQSKRFVLGPLLPHSVPSAAAGLHWVVVAVVAMVVAFCAAFKMGPFSLFSFSEISPSPSLHRNYQVGKITNACPLEKRPTLGTQEVPNNYRSPSSYPLNENSPGFCLEVIPGRVAKHSWVH